MPSTKPSLLSFASTVLLLWLLAVPSHADFAGASVTFDNDLFIGDDSGYTNGVFFSLYELAEDKSIITNDLWVTPLLWSLGKDEPTFAVNSYTLGQTMATPSDITEKDPPRDELPYSAMISLTNTYLKVTPHYADSISTTLGIIGPAALGEETQTFIHKMIGVNKPRGWDHQLKNEVVFQFSRGRVWRSWISETGNCDLLSGLELSLGTIQSSLEGTVYLRYGSNLQESYATTLFNSSRATNPLGVDGGWHIYAGVQAGYTLNIIFADGNTFRESRSIDYDHKHVGVTIGLAYSWRNSSLTFAVTDANILLGDNLENISQYGTLTFAWRL